MTVYAAYWKMFITLGRKWPMKISWDPGYLDFCRSKFSKKPNLTSFRKEEACGRSWGPFTTKKNWRVHALVKVLKDLIEPILSNQCGVAVIPVPPIYAPPAFCCDLSVPPRTTKLGDLRPLVKFWVAAPWVACLHVGPKGLHEIFDLFLLETVKAAMLYWKYWWVS